MNSKIKLSARNAISGSYFKVVPYIAAIILIYIVFSACNAAVNRCFPFADKGLLAAVAALTLPVFVAVVAPLRLKLQLKFLLLARGRYSYYKTQTGFLKACELSIRLFFVRLFWGAVFEGAPFIGSVFFVWYISRNTLSLRAAYSVAAGIFVLAAVGFVFYLVFIQRYSKSWFYLASYGDFSASDAINESVRKTQGKLLETFIFKLGFLPWFLLCVAVIPAFFVVPYYKQSVTCFYLSR